VEGESNHFLKQDREVILSGATKIMPEQSFTDAQGNSRLFYTVKVPFTVAGTNEKAVLGIATDITDQKQAELERLKIIADIVQRNKDLEQFSYIVSHNLRAPVTNIMALSGLLLMGKHDESRERQFMEGLSTSVNKLDEVIRDLNYVLQVKQQVNQKKEPVRLSGLCEDIGLSIDNLLRSEGVKMVTDFTEVDEVLSFKSYLYSIFFNLISNSIKYHRPGVAPVIEIKSTRRNSGFELTFSDNGLGIDLEKKGSQVFGLYKRFHAHTEGKGMGLFMVKSQVESIGGTITIESEVNKGTTFRIIIENN
jgi:signal transduction histidine kinase